MDENEYELISKEELKKLKNKIKQLETENQMTKSKEIENKSSLKENSTISKNLDDIKELNKKTLNSILSKEENINSKMDILIETSKQMVENISILISEIQENNKKL